ncbi:hypothetical protein [Streptomyces sp. AS02]|uniref:hypothetical protein n=1 Tax=Streptomyces sp. AS02 TaxID=2938946 RepID=UPI0020219DE0|nr:hypothetical protein [Streptomyces sp. AS02]MCL8016926.1 hypothetical protein [Streptomyces sp. AS02]
MNTSSKNRIAGAALALTLAVGAVIAQPHDAHGAVGPVTSGSGWKLRTGVTHIDTKPWQITFHDATSRTKLTGYLKNNAAELTYRLGVQFTVTTKLIPVSRTTCLPSHTISYRWQSKPDPANPNRSFAVPCTSGQAPHSASIYINSDYWSPTRNFAEGVRRNVIWHETGHAVGLAHPATCPTDRYGRKPIMCDVNSYKALTTWRYSSYENTAFKYLKANRAYYPMP